MVLEKQLGNGCTWINLDLDKLKKTRGPFLKSTVWTRKPSNMRWIEMSVPTWIITVKMGL